MAKLFIKQAFTSIFGSIFGFASGGYTGDVGRDKVAGVVHGRESVVNADATAKHRALLEAINRGAPIVAPPASPSVGRAGGASTTILSAPIEIKVEGGSRGEQADAELANKIGRKVHESLRSLVAGEIKTQMRPGGIMFPR